MRGAKKKTGVKKMEVMKGINDALSNLMVRKLE